MQQDLDSLRLKEEMECGLVCSRGSGKRKGVLLHCSGVICSVPGVLGQGWGQGVSHEDVVRPGDDGGAEVVAVGLLVVRGVLVVAGRVDDVVDSLEGV